MLAPALFPINFVPNINSVLTLFTSLINTTRRGPVHDFWKIFTWTWTTVTSATKADFRQKNHFVLPRKPMDLSSSEKPEGTEELQEFLYLEQQKAQLRAQIQLLTDTCWDKCVDKPQAKMDSKSETCLENCAARFVDVTLLVTNRFLQVVQRAAGQ